MINNELITTEIPFLVPEDDGNRALDIMENFFISNLPVIDGKEYSGMISMDDIYNFDLFEIKLKNFKKPLQRVFVIENQHIYDVIKALSIYQISSIPVLDAKSNYKGLITQKSILESLAKITAIAEDGFHLKFVINYIDFSATQIANIVENNESKLLSLYIDNHNTTEIFVFIKVLSKDIEALISSFERYNYSPVLLNTMKEDFTDFYQERLDNFLHFLNI